MNYILVLFLSCSVLAFEPSLRSFYQYSDGNYLDLHLNTIATGSGAVFKSHQQREYLRILKGGEISFELRNLSENKILKSSENTDKLFYGASITKVFIASSFLENRNFVSRSQRQSLSDLIVKSSNIAWSKLQIAIGDGEENLGRRRVQEFLNRLSIFDSIGFRGYLGDLHGNEVNVNDLGTFIQASFNNKYDNALELFKLMFLSRTGKKRLKKYLPSNLVVGGKTGTYSGATSVHSIPLNVAVKHHMIVFKHKKNVYSLIVLSDGKTDEELACFGGGIIRDLIKY